MQWVHIALGLEQHLHCIEWLRRVASTGWRNTKGMDKSLWRGWTRHCQTEAARFERTQAGDMRVRAAPQSLGMVHARMQTTDGFTALARSIFFRRACTQVRMSIPF